jgi:hypothetical protein
MMLTWWSSTPFLGQNPIERNAWRGMRVFFHLSSRWHAECGNCAWASPTKRNCMKFWSWMHSPVEEPSRVNASRRYRWTEGFLRSKSFGSFYELDVEETESKTLKSTILAPIKLIQSKMGYISTKVWTSTFHDRGFSTRKSADCPRPSGASINLTLGRIVWLFGRIAEKDPVSQLSLDNAAWPPLLRLKLSLVPAFGIATIILEEIS